MSIGNATQSRRAGWVLACILAASPAVAGDSPWYVTARVGQADAGRDFGPPVFGWTVDDTDNAAAVEVGYLLHPRLAVEAGYADLGSHRGDPRPCRVSDPCPLVVTGAGGAAQFVPVQPTKANLTGYSFAVVPRWPIGDRFAVFGKLGYLWWDADFERVGDGVRVRSDSSGDALFGAGVRYDLPGGLGLLAEIEDTDLARVWSAGASWRF